MVPICDHTSVGLLVWNEDKLLLHERAKKPIGFAFPAGHVDGDSSFEFAARRELKEETALDTFSLELVLEGRYENLCRREGGTWHYWKLYKADVSGSLYLAPDESKSGGWYDRQRIVELAKRTEQYRSGLISVAEWEAKPGLELFCYDLFKKLEII